VKSVFLAAVLIFAVVPLATAQTGAGACRVIDSVAVEGAVRLDEATVLSRAGIVTGAQTCRTEIQRAIERIYGTGQVADVQVFQTRVDARQILIFTVQNARAVGSQGARGTE